MTSSDFLIVLGPANFVIGYLIGRRRAFNAMRAATGKITVDKSAEVVAMRKMITEAEAVADTKIAQASALNQKTLKSLEEIKAMIERRSR